MKVEDLSDKQLEMLYNDSLLGPKEKGDKMFNRKGKVQREAHHNTDHRDYSDFENDYRYYTGGSQGRLGTLDPKKEEGNPSQVWGLLTQDYKDFSNAGELSDLFRQIGDERLNRRLAGLEAPKEEEPEDEGPLLQEGGEMTEDTKEQVDAAKSYFDGLGNTGTDVFGQRNAYLGYDDESYFEPTDAAFVTGPGESGSAQDAAKDFAKKYKLQLGDKMSSGDRESFKDGTSPVISAGTQLFR